MNAPHRDTGFFTEPLASRDPELFGGRGRHDWHVNYKGQANGQS